MSIRNESETPTTVQETCLLASMAAYAQVPPDTTAVFGVPKNVKGNVSGAIGYRAGYGIDIKELIFE